MDWSAVIPQFVRWLTGLIADGNALAQAILALLTTLSGIAGAVAALRGRARKTPPRGPIAVPQGTPSKERNARLPELREMRRRQEALVFRNNLAGVVLIPVAVFAASIYLILLAASAAQRGDVVLAVGAVIVTAAMGLCWLLQRNLNPQWRAKQALHRIELLSKSISEIETEIRRDAKSQEKIKALGSDRITEAEARERADIGVGV